MLPFLIASIRNLNSIPELTFDYVSFRGLQVRIGDVAVIEASGFQYYEKGWKKGYFSSAWKPITVFKGGDGSTTVISNSDDGRVANRQVFTPTLSGFRVSAEFRWRGDKPAMLEYNIGRLWAPYVAHGRLSIDQRLIGNIEVGLNSGSTFESRLLGSGKELAFDTPSAKVTFKSQQNLSLLDGRNYNAEWAEGRELFWLGHTDQEIQPQGTARFDYEVTVEPQPLPLRASETLSDSYSVLESAQSSTAGSKPLIPQPKQIQRSGGFVSVAGGFDVSAPNSTGLDGDWLNRFIEESWIWEKNGKPFPVAISVSPSVVKINGYRLNIRSDGAEIVGQSAEGARYGLRTLGQLVTVNKGELSLPLVTINDWPSAQWRGVHLFVGPTALNFQSKLIDRVLAPLKLNKVVLQCERTKWDSTPGIETAITMKKSDLAALAGRYRSEGFEVIPLIQTLGHMEWFFANKKNLDLAVNPDVAYTLDPRKAESRAKVSAIWNEVQELLKPKIAHFGLDEIANRGIDDPNLVSRIWDKGLPMVQSVANEHKMIPMVWSDMMLAPGEAVDACHAPSKEIASARRKMLRAGTYVADWHYKNDANLEPFDKSLSMWKSIGMRPIASTWYRPKNIRGFTLSAIKNQAGILQTTWAGYESNEANFVREFEQFVGFVMMADYSWSGRTEMPDNLGYDPSSYLQQMYFGGRQPVKPIAGKSLGEGVSQIQIGSFRFRKFEPKQMFGVTRSEAFNAPHQMNLLTDEKANEVVLAMDCLATINESAVAGNIRIIFTDGTQIEQTIRYGMDVRSVTDKKSTISSPRRDTLSAIRIPTSGKELKSIEIVASNSAAGLRLHAVTIL